MVVDSPHAPLPARPDAPPVSPSRAAASLATSPAPVAPLGRRADLAVGFEPLSAQSTLINLRMRYAITVTNNGSIDAADVAVRIGLFAGSRVNPGGIAQWIVLEGEAPHHRAARIAPGETHRFEGELAAPLDALNPVTVDGRTLAIPLVAVDARYGHGPGEAPIEGQSARSFVVGREPQGGTASAKLAPFRLDQGPASFTPLGTRDTGIGRVA
jgi:hypothetical protein